MIKTLTLREVSRSFSGCQYYNFVVSWYINVDLNITNLRIDTGSPSVFCMLSMMS